MTTDAEVACPDPHCGARFRITRGRAAHVPARRRDGRAAAVTSTRPSTRRARAGLHDLADRQGRLAAGRRPRRDRSRRRARRHARVRRRRHHHLRLRRHLHRRRVAHRRLRRASAAARRTCRFTPSTSPIAAGSAASPPRDVARRGRALAGAARRRARSTWCSSTGGTTACPGAIDALGWLDDERRAGRVRHLGVTNFDTPTLARAARRRAADRVAPGAVLGARPAAGGARCARCVPRAGCSLLCYGTRGRRIPLRALSRRGRRPATPLENRSLVKYRLIIEEAGGWPALQRLLDRAGAGCRAARRRRRRGGDGLGAAAATGRRGHRRRASCRALASAATAASLSARRRRRADHRRTPSADGPPVPGDVYALERVAADGMPAVMSYELNSSG